MWGKFLIFNLPNRRRRTGPKWIEMSRKNDGQWKKSDLKGVYKGSARAEIKRMILRWKI